MAGRLARFFADGYGTTAGRIVQLAAIGLLVLAVCALIAFAAIWAVAAFA